MELQMTWISRDFFCSRTRFRR